MNQYTLSGRAGTPHLPNMAPRSPPPTPRPRPLSALQNGWVKITLLLMSPLIVSLLLLWWLVGTLLTMPPFVVGAVALASSWAVYLTLPGIPVALLDTPLVLTAAVGLIIASNRHQKWQSSVFALAALVYAIARGSVTSVAPGRTTELFNAALVFVAIFPVWLTLVHARLWLPADDKLLEDLERSIYRKYIVTDHEMQLVAGLGTVHVPYCGDSRHLPPRTLVLVHGYMAGNAFWAANLQTLAKWFNVYAVEWKGIGRSDRPTFKPKNDKAADDFFVESLEEWRRTIQLDRFILLGHSMGGMYSTYYAARYPQHIDHMILVSPAGVNSSPVTDDELPTFFKVVAALHITPMSMVRFVGPFGPALVRWILRKRISWVPPSNIIRSGDMDFDHITMYCYHNWALKKSGEIALYTHLHPGASARTTPLCELLAPGRAQVPVTFLYGGGSDWMDADHGEAVVRRLEKQHYAAFRLVPLAGHQVFMDNPTDFNHIVIEAVHEYERATAFGGVPSSGPPAPSAHSPRPSRMLENRKLQAAIVLLSPLLMLWRAIGYLLTMPPQATGVTGVIVIWLAYVLLPQVGTVETALALIAVLLVLTSNRKLKWQSGLVSLTALARRHAMKDRMTNIVGIFAAVFPVWVTLLHLCVWVPADDEELERLEHAIYKKFVSTKSEMSVVAGLGTVHVPYSGEPSRHHQPRTLVLVHGYMGGNVYWAANLQALSEWFDVCAVEWQGIGRSHRPTFEAKNDKEADDFNVESIERWRQAMQLERFVLCGHSMGVSLSMPACFRHFTRYPQHVAHLILVSPAGVNPSLVTNEQLATPWKVIGALGITPMSVIRFVGPFGPVLVR
ncbi:TPA: hypothetical protein N0F65_001564 [Lagenidium giganteum]|uniref:AB hydrolase-1 domain-containing protein n=1 Tax=Lagenidium giganteum TaxID=4803 RepID=A0AAV2YEG1_9STRA|nr:TPA: hypothetical protein N0F65_001564 [Lagenidium giganteum]